MSGSIVHKKIPSSAVPQVLSNYDRNLRLPGWLPRATLRRQPQPGPRLSVREPGHRGGGEAHEGLCGLRSHPMLRGPWTKTHSLSPRTGKPQVSREASRGLEPGAWSSVPRVPGGIQVSGHLPQEVFLSTACTLAPPSRDHSEARRGLVSACHISGDTAALSGREPETPNVLQCTHITTTMLAVPCPRGGARVPGCLLRHRARCRC